MRCSRGHLASTTGHRPSRPSPTTGRRTHRPAQPIGNDVTADLAVRRADQPRRRPRGPGRGRPRGLRLPRHRPVDGAPWYEPSSSDRGRRRRRGAAAAAGAGRLDRRATATACARRTASARRSRCSTRPTTRCARAWRSRGGHGRRRAGIEITARAGSWDEIDQRMHADAVLFGWGSHDPTEMYNLYHSSMAGIEYVQPRLSTPNAGGRPAPRGGDGRHRPRRGRPALARRPAGRRRRRLHRRRDAAWAWLVNLEHTYFVDDCLDLGAGRGSSRTGTGGR